MAREGRTSAGQSSREKRFWVWVTSSNYYINEEGKENPDLDPATPASERMDNWWTCHKDTEPGDLVLVYRSRPKSDIAYLLEARSKAKIWRETPPGTLTASQYHSQMEDFLAESRNKRFADELQANKDYAADLGLSDEEFEEIVLCGEAEEVVPKFREVWHRDDKWLRSVNRAMGLPEEPLIAGPFDGSWVCDYEPRLKLKLPITRAELLAQPAIVKNWAALRGNFQQRAYEIPSQVFGRLTELIAEKNPGFERTVDRLLSQQASEDILSEKRFEDALVKNLAKLRPEFDLELYRSPEGESGRQYPCVGSNGAMGFIDLLCVDRKTKGLVVVELKVVKAGLPAFAQIRSYIGWVKENVADGREVTGVLIADGYDEKYRYAAATSHDVAFFELNEAKRSIGLITEVA